MGVGLCDWDTLEEETLGDMVCIQHQLPHHFLVDVVNNIDDIVYHIIFRCKCHYMDIVIDLVIDIVILLLSCYEILDLLSATVTEISNGKILIESKMRAMRSHCEGVGNKNKQRNAKNK